MERHALLFRVKPGTEDRRRRDPRRPTGGPPTEIDAETRLLGTTVLMHGNVVVRTMEIEGSLPRVAAHLARQPRDPGRRARAEPVPAGAARHERPRGRARLLPALGDDAADAPRRARAPARRHPPRRAVPAAPRDRRRRRRRLHRRRRPAAPGRQRRACSARPSSATRTPSCASSRSSATSTRRSSTSSTRPRCSRSASAWPRTSPPASTSPTRTGCGGSSTDQLMTVVTDRRAAQVA